MTSASSTPWKWRLTACLIIWSSAAITNAVCSKNRRRRMASSVEIVVSGRHRSRSSMSTTNVTPISFSNSSKLVRRASISFGGEVVFLRLIKPVAVFSTSPAADLTASTVSLSTSPATKLFPNPQSSPRRPAGGSPNASETAEPPASLIARNQLTRSSKSFALSIPVFRSSASFANVEATTSISAARASSYP